MIKKYYIERILPFKEKCSKQWIFSPLTDLSYDEVCDYLQVALSDALDYLPFEHGFIFHLDKRSPNYVSLPEEIVDIRGQILNEPEQIFSYIDENNQVHYLGGSSYSLNFQVFLDDFNNFMEMSDYTLKETESVLKSSCQKYFGHTIGSNVIYEINDNFFKGTYQIDNQSFILEAQILSDNPNELGKILLENIKAKERLIK
ncbi:MAG: hypothetical protein ACRCU3_01915 [Eubacteriaceae bacterium]